MINDLDETIKKIFEKEFPEDLMTSTSKSSEKVDISFARPDEQSIAASLSGNAIGIINFFLYDIEENLEYRTSRSLVQHGQVENGTGTFTNYPPARINYSYLVTAWTKADDPLVEHYILSEAIEILMRNLTIPEDVLQGRLIGIKPLPITTCLHPNKLNPGEFWQAMGGKPRPALNYTVTLDIMAFKDIKLNVVGEDKVVVKVMSK